MKKVLPQSEVAHTWANQSQDEARTSNRNLYFDGATIYSYGSHFPIAKHIEHNGVSACLFTLRSYSNSTAKHKSIVRQASSHLNIVWCGNPDNTHEQNFNYFLNLCEGEASKLLKAKKPEIYLGAIAQHGELATKYAAFFGLELPVTLQAMLNIGNKAEYASYQDNKEQYAKEQAAKRQKDLAKQHKKALAKWVSGETNRLYTHNGLDYLRMGLNGVETSQAVDIPISAAKQLFEKVASGKLAVGDMILNRYTVNEVGSMVKIGCHTFKTSYLIQFGQTHLASN